MKLHILIGTVIICLVILFIAWLVTDWYSKGVQIINQECLEILNQSYPHCQTYVIDSGCPQDCKELNKNYYRYRTGGIQRDECFCLNKNGDVEQIW